MVGEASRSWGTLLTDCLQTFAHLPARGNDFDLERPQYIYLLGIGRDLYQLALLDLFGLMDVKRPSQPVQPWRPASVGHLPFGDAVLTLLAEHFYNPGTLLALQRDENQAADFGAWQPLFQPYFPERRENLRIAAPEPRTGVFLFRVALGKARRLIAIPADAPLDDLVELGCSAPSSSAATTCTSSSTATSAAGRSGSTTLTRGKSPRPIRFTSGNCPWSRGSR